MNLFFSVIIPVYNGGKFIQRALQSVKSQTYKNYEIIVVDNSSTDNTSSLLKRFVNDNPKLNITIITQNNLGVGGARNTGIRHALGDIIALLDCDDTWYSNKLEETAEEYENIPSASLIYHYQNVIKNGRVVRVFDDSREGNIYDYLVYGRNCIPVSTVTFKRSLISKIGYFKENLANTVEDYDMWLRMCKTKATVSCIMEVLGECHVHDTNLSHNIKAMMSAEKDLITSHFRKNDIFSYLKAYRRLAILYLKYSKQYVLSKAR